MRSAAALAAALLAAPLAAEPVYFEASTRAREAREAPGGAVVGLIPGGEGLIEAVALDPTGAWALVALPERGGWIEIAGLARATPPSLPGAPVPDGLVCLGTEPFWSLALGGDGARHAEPGSDEIRLTLEIAAWPGPPAFPVALRASGEGFDAAGLLRPSACSDGMSDRPYAWALDLIRLGGDAPRRLSGCCLLRRGG